MKRVNVVLNIDPRFQPRPYNKGIFLSHLSRLAENEAQARKYIDQARAAMEAVIALDPTFDVGKQDDAALQNLPKQDTDGSAYRR